MNDSKQTETAPTQAHPHPHTPEVEPDTLSIGTLWMWIAGTTLFVIFSTIGVRELYLKMWRDEVYAARLAPVDSRLELLRTAQQAQLEGYAVVDAEQGLYQVPVTLAMQAIAKDPALLGPLMTVPAPEPKEAAPAPAAADAPAGLEPKPVDSAPRPAPAEETAAP